MPNSGALSTRVPLPDLCSAPICTILIFIHTQAIVYLVFRECPSSGAIYFKWALKNNCSTFQTTRQQFLASQAPGQHYVNLRRQRTLENMWYISEWMMIHSHEANPCFNKTNYPGVFRWQPMITHDPETEWVKITENWWKSRARGQMALKRRICDYYFPSLQSDRAWIYFLWKIYRAIDIICQHENGYICFLPMAND